MTNLPKTDKHNLRNRRFCLSCSPFGSHNTRANIDRPPRRVRSYSSYPREMRTQHARQLLVRAHRAKNWLIQMFGGKCSACGYDRCKQVLAFHHKDRNTKRFSLSSSNLRGRTWKEIVDEAGKCVLLCSNCHIEEEHRIAVERMGMDLSMAEKLQSQMVAPDDDPRGPVRKRGPHKKEHAEAKHSNCKECDASISRYATRCVDCAHLRHRRTGRPEYGQLLQEIASSSKMAVGKKYGVSDNSIRKWIASYERAQQQT